MIAVIDYYEVAERVVDANNQHEQCKLCPKPTKQARISRLKKEED